MPMPTPEDYARKTKTRKQEVLFELPKKYMTEWWGMPSYQMEDARPQHKINVNFYTWDDVIQFAKLLNTKLTKKTNSIWYPTDNIKSIGEVIYDGPIMKPKYPIFIPSKGRWETPLTANCLKQMNCPFYIVVEPCEADNYIKAIGKEHILVLPFENLGQGSIPARNWIWDKAIEMKSKKHWIIDDNVRKFLRLNHNRRIRVKTPAIFRCMEDFTDRYENVAFSGPNYMYFANDREPGIFPFTLNTRIYSITLINNSLPYRWRGKYNEDTDICLRALKDGWSTILFNAFLADKISTLKMKGGNTDTVYATNDHRLGFAESLYNQHPDVVKVVWKFNRWHHQVDYTPFKNNELKLKSNITPTADVNEYGMLLRKREKGEL